MNNKELTVSADLTAYDIELSKIKVNPYQYREDYDEAKMKELEMSMKEKKQKQAIRVVPENDGTYTLIFGHRRVIAARNLGWTTISANFGTRDELIETALDENLVRQNVNPLEKAKGLVNFFKQYFGTYWKQNLSNMNGKIMRHAELTADETMLVSKLRMKGIKLSTAMQLTAVLDLPDDVKTRIEYFGNDKTIANDKYTRGKLTWMHGYHLSRLKVAEAMTPLIEKICQSHMSISTTSKIIAKINESPNMWQNIISGTSRDILKDPIVIYNNIKSSMNGLKGKFTQIETVLDKLTNTQCTVLFRDVEMLKHDCSKLSKVLMTKLE